MSLIDKDEIIRLMHAFNPSWSGRSRAVPPFRRLAYEACRKRLSDPAIRRSILLSGPRRVGKSTVLYQLADTLIKETNDPKRVVYLSLDNPFLKMLSIMEILEIYETSIQKAMADVFLLLDEVQYAKDWDLNLKFIIDQRPEFRIVATGSAALKQKHDTIDSGVGRWVIVPMPTLSFYEFLRIRDSPLPKVPEKLRLGSIIDMSPSEQADLAQRFRPTLPDFQRYLLVGGFPETARSENIDYCQSLIREDVVERVLKRDMVALFGIRKVNELERLFIYLCMYSGGILSVRACASQIGTTAATVSGFLESLESANLIYQLPSMKTGGKKLLREQSKYYLVDAALRNAVLMRGEEVLTNHTELGTIVETAVLRHLFAYSYLDSPSVSFWRDSKTGKEVDVIVKSPKYTIPVEVKYRAAAKIEYSDGLVRYSFNDKAVNMGCMVTREDKDFATVTFSDHPIRYLKIPAHIFTYVLGQAEHRLWAKKSLKH